MEQFIKNKEIIFLKSSIQKIIFKKILLILEELLKLPKILYNYKSRIFIKILKKTIYSYYIKEKNTFFFNKTKIIALNYSNNFD